jgi:tRNA U34 2-thiouridine synthase MnmA/TrmU
MKKVRALVLFSGGLDSVLAAKILMEQGIEVFPVFFKSYFFGPEIAQKSAKENGLKLKVIDFSKEHLKIVKKPNFGYGSSMNPCLDCHILMLKKAKELMKKNSHGRIRISRGQRLSERYSHADFVATGEVLGERPMTQNKKALELVEKESSLSGYLLRPLSAKLLKETIPEKKGLIDREKLLDIQGRSRRRQIELAKEFKIKFYPTPAGGCLLTDPEFGKRLKELLKNYSKFTDNDVELLKLGRHFWEGRAKIVVGRNHQENLKIEKLAQKKDILIEMKNYPGPTTLIRSYGGKFSKEILEKAKNLTKFYSKKARDKKDVEFKII